MMRPGWIPAPGLVLALGLAACGDSGQPLQQPVPEPGENPIEYPVTMWDRRVEGETRLLVHVNEYGNVDTAYVDSTSGHAEFDAAALAGARKLQFAPGRRGEHAIAMWTHLPVRFALDSTASVGPTTAPPGAKQP